MTASDRVERALRRLDAAIEQRLADREKGKFAQEMDSTNPPTEQSYGRRLWERVSAIWRRTGPVHTGRRLRR